VRVCIYVCVIVSIMLYVHIYVYEHIQHIYTHRPSHRGLWARVCVCSLSPTTRWRRLIGSPKLQIIFHKRATKYRSLLRKMNYKDKGSYESSPPCILWTDLLATHCNTLQHTATHCVTISYGLIFLHLTSLPVKTVSPSSTLSSMTHSSHMNVRHVTYE